MPIIVGTMTVWVTPCASMSPITPAGSNSGIVTAVAPLVGVPRIAPIEAAWNIGVWCR